jgi:hypothetical protein
LAPFPQPLHFRLYKSLYSLLVTSAPENGDIMFLRNVGINLKMHTTPKTDFDKKISLQFGIFPDDRLCGLVVSVADYKHRGPGFDSQHSLGFF